LGFVKEKVAYLQGLTKGLEVNEQSSEGKLLVNIIDVLDDFAEEFESMTDAHEDLEEYVTTLDEDLTELEDEVYEDSSCDDDGYVEVECPRCHDQVAFEADVLHDDNDLEITCPSCGTVVYESVFEGDDVSDSYHDDPGL
jgi:ribosomal protein S27E